MFLCSLQGLLLAEEQQLTGCKTSCAQANGPAGRGNHRSWRSSSSRRWPPPCSWSTTASSWSRPPPAASPAPVASSPQQREGPTPALGSATSLPWSAPSCVSFLRAPAGAATGVSLSQSSACGSVRGQKDLQSASGCLLPIGLRSSSSRYGLTSRAESKDGQLGLCWPPPVWVSVS